MARPQDLLVDETGDIIIANGDIVVGDSTQQHQVHLIISQKGEWKQHPQVGVGAHDFINDDQVAALQLEVQKQFELDGMRVRQIEVFEEGKIKFDATYE